MLGAGAGGGFPQWNSSSAACRAARAGEAHAPAASQASITVSGDGEHWLLVNASPDLRQQILATPALAPREDSLRNSPIAGVVLTNGDVDAIAGLLSLREGTPFTLYAHPRVLAVLAANPIFGVLNPALVPHRAVALEQPFAFHGLTVTPFPVAGKEPLYLERDGTAQFGDAGEAIGLEIACAGRRLVYVANCARIDAALLRRIDGADVLFFDGTLWRDDEMIRSGEGSKTGQRMGHVSMSGPEGAIAGLAALSLRRRIFIHINNTNPVLLHGSAERAEAQAAGWEIAFDGQELSL